MKNSLYYKMLPFMSLLCLVVWGFELWKNLKAGRTDRLVIDIILCVAFAIGVVSGIIIMLKNK